MVRDTEDGDKHFYLQSTAMGRLLRCVNLIMQQEYGGITQPWVQIMACFVWVAVQYPLHVTNLIFCAVDKWYEILHVQTVGGRSLSRQGSLPE